MKEGTKYHALYRHLQQSNQEEVSLSLDEIETLLGIPLPASARRNRGWWGNRSAGGAQSTAWMGAGYHVRAIDLEGGRITFGKPKSDYQVRRKGGQIVWDGESIKALRGHMELSQAELAEELGVRQQTISEWETGMYQPKRAISKLITIIAERAGFE